MVDRQNCCRFDQKLVRYFVRSAQFINLVKTNYSYQVKNCLSSQICNMLLWQSASNYLVA